MTSAGLNDRSTVACQVMVLRGLVADDQAETSTGTRGQERSDTRKQQRASTACHVLRVTLRVARAKTGFRNEAGARSRGNGGGTQVEEYAAILEASTKEESCS